MNKDLLRNLADYLEAEDIPEDQFDMEQWGKENGVFCGCAIGWGIKGEILKGAYIDVRLFYKDGDYTEWDAVSEIFDIIIPDAELLFHSESYDNPTKEEVVARIREFING